MELYTNLLFTILHYDIYIWTWKILVIYDISNFLLTFWIYTVIIFGTLHPFLPELYKELYKLILYTLPFMIRS